MTYTSFKYSDLLREHADLCVVRNLLIESGKVGVQDADCSLNIAEQPVAASQRNRSGAPFDTVESGGSSPTSGIAARNAGSFNHTRLSHGFEHIHVPHGSVVFDEVEEDSVSMPDFLGSRQGLTLSRDEACHAGDVDGEGFDGRLRIGRCAGLALVADPVKGDDGDLVALDDAAGRGVALAAGETFDDHDAARGDGVEGEAIGDY